MPGEVYHFGAEADVAVYTAADFQLATSSLVFAQTWKGLAATAGASALWNGRQRRKAERAAAAQWRPSGRGILHLTSERLLLPLDGQLHSFPLRSHVTTFEPYWDSYGAALQLAGCPPVALRGHAVPYVSVALHTLLFRVVPTMTSPG